MTPDPKPQRGAKKADNSQLDEYAFALFVDRSRGARRDAKTIAAGCYKLAGEFVEVQEQIHAGKLVTEVRKSALLESFAPNLDHKKDGPSHPYNLASREYGNFDRVVQINDWFKANPNRDAAYSDDNLSWDAPTTRCARDIFPFVIERAKQFGLIKETEQVGA